ncbi:PilT/PilU family type 4a pilus ATPase [Methylophilus sp. 5]|uniref:PilT/PilU family type 4a pilus ATPase n=1 Tax=Methylophilus sp. 5 TaxID=1112274 RepID=UPI0004914437|nr:PilT/PilU family type 4a pilus ATPase [Methylophilus sp. 5]
MDSTHTAGDHDQTEKFVTDLLKLMVTRKASDLFITAGFPPAMKIDGKLTPVSTQTLNTQQTAEIGRAVMNDKQAQEFKTTLECNFAISMPSVGRFRVNAFIQRSAVGLVFRVINTNIPKFDDLKLPQILKEVVMAKRGLIIFVGGTGSGKSTSMAAMLGHRNESSYGHIITIEDPVEFIHGHRNCIVTQREVGVDTESWHAALKNTLRQAPDVIMIGEIRDRETMDYAIAFSETGHLCLATLHANSTNQALDRIINFFPEERRQQLLMDLSLNLRCVASQRLIPKIDGSGRVAAVEVLLHSPLISDLIYKGDVHAIKEIMAKSRELGMQTFDQALFDLFESGQISYDDALRNADSVNDLRLKFKLNSKMANPENQERGKISDLDIL